MSHIRYSIQYEDYCGSLMNGFGELMQMQNLVDTTLMCNTHTLRVHKVILAASSLYFQEILKNRPGELLIILKIDFIVLKSLVEYIYSGKTNILKTDMDELISAAKFLKIKGLSELHEGTDNLPEFSPPLIFNQPYGSTQESHQIADGEGLPQENVSIPPNTFYPKNVNNVVVRIPIDINSHNGASNRSEGSRNRNKYKQHHYDWFNDIIPMNKITRRRGYYNKPEHRSGNMLGTRQLNRATRKVLRKEEKSSLQTIQEIKSFHGQFEVPNECSDLSEAVDSILNPNFNFSGEEFTINQEEQTTESIEISEQFSDDNHTWAMENQSENENNNPHISSTLSEYVDVLKSTGLPTDVPILFELEDGSYVNISGEVLLNMVQSNSVQYEVVEHTEDTEQLLQNGITKSIDQISEEIGTSISSNKDHFSNTDHSIHEELSVNLDHSMNVDHSVSIMECLRETENVDITMMEECVMNDSLDQNSFLNNFNTIIE